MSKTYTKCQITNLAKQLIKKKSISPMDNGCQKILIKFLKKNNFIIETMNFKNTNNFIAFHGTHGNTLMFAGHTDVVPPGNINNWKYNPFSATIKNGILYGRGSSDMKGAIASMLIAAKKFIKKKPNHNGRLAFLITSDEEIYSKNGTLKVINELILRNEKIDYCIVGEPTSKFKICDTIKNGRRGSLYGSIKIYGIQGHVAYPECITNPAHISLSFLKKLISINKNEKKEKFPNISLQIFELKTNFGKKNVTPSELIIKFNIRFSNKLNKQKIYKKIKKILDEYNLNYKFTCNVSANPFISKDKKLLNLVSNIINKKLGYIPNISQDGGTSDARFISKICSETIELGLLNNTIHKENECVHVNDLKKLSNIYEKIMKNILL